MQPAADPSNEQDIFTPKMLADIAEHIRQIRLAGGNGELIIKFVRGHVRFIDRRTGEEYPLPKGIERRA